MKVNKIKLGGVKKMKQKINAEKENWKNLFEYYQFTKRDEKKYPVVSKILKELTPEKIKKEVESIQKIKLPPNLQKWVVEYEKVGKREKYLWLWAYKSIPLITHSCVSKKYYSSLWEIKCLYVILFTLIDDVADKIKSKALLNEVSKIPYERDEVRFDNLTLEEKKYLNTTINILNALDERIRRYPRYDELKSFLYFDLCQVLHMMRYAYLVNKNHYLINRTEYFRYFPYNMPFIYFLTTDLMCSPKFNIEEFGTMREITWQAQKLGQDINWLTTWEREIEEEDITSGIFAYANSFGILEPSEFRKENKDKIIEKIKNKKIEKELLKKSEKFYYNIEYLKNRVKSVNIEKFLLGIKNFIILQLSSKGNY